MRIPPDAKLYELRPLTGPLDPSSSPDAVLAGGHRWVQNFRVNASGALARAEGFRRLLHTSTGYNNADLHNQLEKTESGATAEDITLLFEAGSSSAGLGKLLAGTKSRLYALNTKTKNWKLVGESMSGDGAWKAAQLGEFVVFVKESGTPVYYKYDQPREQESVGGNLVDKTNSLKEIDSFKEIGLNRVRHIKEWRGLMFYGNVSEGNELVPDRLVWSDFKKPFEITPNVTDSLAGYQDLGEGEEIVGMEPIANVLLIYTKRGIWQFEVSGGTGTDVLTFRKRYSDEANGAMIPNYPNTIVAAGDQHFYLGRDGVYSYNVYKGNPAKEEWLQLASSVIFNDINTSLCELPIASFNARNNEVWISWPSKNATKNDKTLIINTKYRHVSYMDAGFTAFTNYTNHSYTSLGEWMSSTNYVCSPSKINSFREGTEGASTDVFSTVVGTPAITEIFNFDSDISSNGTPNVISDTGFSGDDLKTENWGLTAESTSLYTKLGSTTYADLCTVSCPDEVRFVMAYATDNCLKEDGNTYIRERYNGSIYEEDDYRSILTSPALRLNDPTKDKLLRALTLEFNHAQAGGRIVLRVGNSAQATDPNKVGCGLVWHKQSDEKSVSCVTESTRTEHATLGTRASEELTWPLYTQGRNLYYELSVSGTGGAFEATAVRLYAATQKT